MICQIQHLYIVFVFILFLTPRGLRAQLADPITVAHAHNDILEFICEWGLLGTFCFFIPYILHLVKVCVFTNSTTVRLLLLGCFVFLVYCFVDFPTRTPACFALFSCVAGLACKYDNLSAHNQRGF